MHSCTLSYTFQSRKLEEGHSETRGQRVPVVNTAKHESSETKQQWAGEKGKKHGWKRGSEEGDAGVDELVLSPCCWAARVRSWGWLGGEMQGAQRWPGWLYCAGSYWQSCSCFRTTLHTHPPQCLRTWLSPDCESCAFGCVRFSLPQCYAGDDEKHVQTFQTAFTQLVTGCYVHHLWIKSIWSFCGNLSLCNQLILVLKACFKQPYCNAKNVWLTSPGFSPSGRELWESEGRMWREDYTTLQRGYLTAFMWL